MHLHCTKNWIYHYSKPVDNAAFGRKYDQMRHYLKFTVFPIVLNPIFRAVLSLD